jgi:hypothetical protein
VIYEWDPEKARTNLHEHKLAFDEATGPGLSVPEARLVGSAGNMRTKSEKDTSDELLPEFDLAELKGEVRGKYFREATAGTNLVLIEPDLASVFPDSESVNRALRLLVDAAEAAISGTRR